MTAESISLRAAAEQLGLHYMTVYRYVRTGRLAATKTGGQWLVDPADLETLTIGSDPETRDGSRARAARLLEARLIAADEAGAWSVVAEALTSGAQPADIHLRLLVPALQSIGDRWESGDLSVLDEHQATSVATRIVARLGPRFQLREPARSHVVVGLVAGDTHALTSSIIADLLRGVGLAVTDLGADTPAESFLEVVDSAAEPPVAAAVISVSCGSHQPAVARTVDAIRRQHRHFPIAIGGSGIADEAEALALGATFWGPELQDLLDSVDDLIRP